MTAAILVLDARFVTIDGLCTSNFPDTLRNMDRKPGIQDQADRSRRWREGVKQRLDQIQAELREIGAGIEQQLAALTDRLGENERQQGAAAVKPPTDTERRFELKRLRLCGERDQFAHERDRLRREMLAALVMAGSNWRQDARCLDLKQRLEAVAADWNEVVAELRRLDAEHSPPAVAPRPPPVIGGILQTHVPVMRTRR
jgi:hypothetical protein